ncbi:MAG: exodeoxyribonuclease VII small subunit [Deltaproteobacteria bacterium]|jgi:exodeoxyribonuclease VII small subunit|nr:exodeoxyribonuclease VII small subunit [Deltaproteobacteria bacterium]
MVKETNLPPKGEEESFEAGLDRLTKLVSSLESQELSLDEAIAAFEDGVVLSQKLSEKLKTAEAKLEILTKGPDGLPSSKPLVLEDGPAAAKSETEE